MYHTIKNNYPSIKTKIPHQTMKNKLFHFLVAGIFLLISGLFLFNAVEDHKRAKMQWDIYYELPKHVYMASVHLKYEFIEAMSSIRGVIIKGYFVFPAHCGECERIERTAFGIIRFNNGSLIKREIKLGKHVLEEVYFDIENDIAIYRLPEELKLPDFPCATGEVDLGDKIFIIGNPKLAGLNIRQGNVSSIKSLMISKGNYVPNIFCVDTTVYSGDSGSPVISADYKLVGIVTISFGPDITGVKYIKEFIDRIK